MRDSFSIEWSGGVVFYICQSKVETPPAETPYEYLNPDEFYLLTCYSPFSQTCLFKYSKSLPFPGNLASATFGQIIYNVLNRGKSARPPLFNGLQVLPSASDKANLLAETPSGTPIMMTHVSFACFLPFWQTYLH